MNSYASLKKQNTSRLTAAAILALCVLLSGTMLFSRLAAFSAPDTCHYIPLTQSGGITSVTRGQLKEDGSFQPTVRHPGRPRLLTAMPGFEVWDENTVWQGHTDIEIFRISYDNAVGEMTVNSSNGDKLLAPGTESLYEFALENTGNVALSYRMEMEAYFSHEEYPIPVHARVTDYQGNYLAGSREAKTDVLDLNGVSQTGTIAPGNILPYTLEWEWPFEIDDAYDTMLGNLAVEEDITLTIVIRTLATYTPEPGGGIPQTGDTSDIAMMTTMMLASGAGLLILLLMPGRKREEADG